MGACKQLPASPICNRKGTCILECSYTRMHFTHPQPDNILWSTIVFGLVSVYIYYHAPASCPLALPVGNEHGATEVAIDSAHAPLFLTAYSAPVAIWPQLQKRIFSR